MPATAELCTDVRCLTCVIFFALFFTRFFAYYLEIMSPRQPTEMSRAFASFRSIFAFVWLGTLLIYGLTALFVVDVFRTERVAPDRRALWLIVLLIGGSLAMPVYWFLYVWREPPSPAPSPAPPSSWQPPQS